MRAIRIFSLAISALLIACLPSAFDGAERAERARQATSRSDAARMRAGAGAGRDSAAGSSGRAGDGGAGTRAGRAGQSGSAGSAGQDDGDAGQTPPSDPPAGAAGGAGRSVAGAGMGAAGSAGPTGGPQPPASGTGGSGSACGDTAHDVNNCGTCGNDCNASMALASCVDSSCVRACTATRADCNMDLQFGAKGDGCETEISADVDNCGGCRLRCDRSEGSVPECTDRHCLGARASVGAAAAVGNGPHGSIEGGGPYEQICGSNSVLVGIDAAADSDMVLGFSALCAPLIASGVAGNLAVSLGDVQEFPLLGNILTEPLDVTQLRCPAGQIVTAIGGTTWYAGAEYTMLSIKSLILTCAMLRVDAQRLVTSPGGQLSGGSPDSSLESFQDTCPSGQAVVGIRGRSGAWIDAVETLCAPLTFMRQIVGTFEAEP